MKKKIVLTLVLLLTLSLPLGGFSVQAATQNEIEAAATDGAIDKRVLLGPNSPLAPQADIDQAIDDGALWLANNQNVDGSWDAAYQTAATCMALAALETYATGLGYADWTDPAFAYRANVQAGWQYVFQPAYTQQITPLPVQTAGNPDTNANGYGIRFDADSAHEGYVTGLCMMALEMSKTPNRQNDGGLNYNGDATPDTFKEIMQEAVDWYAFAQNEAGASGQGSWMYTADNGTGLRSDQSVAGHAALGLTAAEAWGCTVPAFVRTELSFAIDNFIQCNPGDAGYTLALDGSAGYSVPCGPGPHGVSNDIYKAGHLFTQLAFLGDDPLTSSRYQRAVDYVELEWRNTTVGDPGWGYGDPATGDYLGMFALEKGLTYSGIELLDTDGDGQSDDSWYNQEPPVAYPNEQDFASFLVNANRVHGTAGTPTTPAPRYWGTSIYGTFERDTAWALLILERAAPAPPTDLVMEKSVAPPVWAPIDPGEHITYTIRFSQTAAIAATGVSVVDIVPVEVLNPSWSSAGAAIIQTNMGVQTYTWDVVAAMATGDWVVITITGDLDDPLPATFVNTATVSTTSPEPNRINNEDTVEIVANDTGDPDGDGVTNAWEILLGTDPNDADSDSSKTAPDENDNGTGDADEDFDGDGIPNLIEIKHGTNPMDSNDPAADPNGDPDGDGVTNAWESLLGTNPNVADSDGDGTDDGDEDSDGDGIPNALEIKYGYDPLDPNDPVADPNGDPDGDGVTNAWEALLGTDPNDPDSDSTKTTPANENDNGIGDADEDFDGDGIPNSIEIKYGTDPMDGSDPWGDDPGESGLPTDDNDGDGVPNAWERILGTDPTKADTDGDGTDDGDEDFDGDGVSNADEIANGTDPLTYDPPPVGGHTEALGLLAASWLWVLAALVATGVVVALAFKRRLA